MLRSKDPKWLRYEMVRYARDHGVKPVPQDPLADRDPKGRDQQPTARAFNTIPRTVRKWLSRWQPGSLRGLEDRRKGPNSKRSKIDPKQRVKAKWRLFEQIDIDTKHLYDIPEYFIQMKKHNLSRYQYTARDVVSGLQFLGYASECTLTCATLFAETIIDHLKACGVNLKGSRIQTDNGTEFVGAWSAKEPSVFTNTVQAEKGLIHTRLMSKPFTG